MPEILLPQWRVKPLKKESSLRLKDRVAIAPGRTMSGANLRRGEDTDAHSIRACDTEMTFEMSPDSRGPVGTVVYLSSPDNDMMTRQVLLVDGGAAFY